MIARIARWGGTVSFSCLAALSMQAMASAADVPPAPLILDKAFTAATGKTVEDQPSSLMDCSEFPERGKPYTDGWRFNQPVTGGTPLAYVIGYVETVNGKAKPSLIGMIAGHMYKIDVNEATVAGDFGPEDLLPAPDGVRGVLAADGLWLSTPQGWRLASGALMVNGGSAAGRTTFALTAVCRPPVPTRLPPLPSFDPPPPLVPPIPSPSATDSESGTDSQSTTDSESITDSGSTVDSEPAPLSLADDVSPSASAGAVPVAAGALPVTGARSGVVAWWGLVSVAVGLVMVTVWRRRGRIRFRA